jgi:hypothetical protein
MWFRYLIASAACAALLGLAASGLVRLNLAGIISAMTPAMPVASQPGGSAQPDADSLTVAGDQPASTTKETTEGAVPETDPTSSLPPEPTKRRRGRGARGARSPSRHDPARKEFSRELDRGIRKLGKRRYEIKRAALELALRNLPSLSGSVRVAPEIRDGKPFGFRLFAIKADGPIAKLGLQDEDVLVAINGLDITTPDRVLNAYGKLKTARRLMLKVVREGRTMVQEYSIR